MGQSPQNKTSVVMGPHFRYRGLTKRRYKRMYGSSTSGKEKGYNCHALPVEKGLMIYPRSYKTDEAAYRECNARKQAHFNTKSDYFKLA